MAAAAGQRQAAAGWDADAHMDLYATVPVEFADMAPDLDTGRRASQAEQPGVEVVKLHTGTEVAERNLSTADQGVSRQALLEEPDPLQEPLALLQSVVAAQEALEEEGEHPLQVGAVLHLTAEEGHIRPLMPQQTVASPQRGEMGRTTLADLAGEEHWPVLRSCWPKHREGHNTRLAGGHTLAVAGPHRAHLHHTLCDKVEKPLKPAGLHFCKVQIAQQCSSASNTGHAESDIVQ